jgi:hypothetical protein
MEEALIRLIDEDQLRGRVCHQAGNIHGETGQARERDGGGGWLPAGAFGFFDVALEDFIGAADEGSAEGSSFVGGSSFGRGGVTAFGSELSFGLSVFGLEVWTERVGSSGGADAAGGASSAFAWGLEGPPPNTRKAATSAPNPKRRLTARRATRF